MRKFIRWKDRPKNRKGIKYKYNGRGIAPDERMTSYELSWPVDHDHGHPDHKGQRCAACAAESKNPVLIHPNSGDYWQTRQINWQEECDLVFRSFDDSVAEHFPLHTGPQCNSCPVKPVLPPKPVPIYERALHQ